MSSMLQLSSLNEQIQYFYFQVPQMLINILALMLLGLITFYALLNHHIRLFYTNYNPQIQPKYEIWKKKFSMQFSEKQNIFRFQVFSQNLHQIQAHNSVPTKSYTLGLNQYAHLTQTQFSQLLLGKLSISNFNLQRQPVEISFINLKKLTDIDWQSLGKVSEVKSQGNCNAGYAFSIISLIQSSLLMQNQKVLLSVQQVIDCAGDYGAMGCDGGSRDGVLKYVLQRGLNTQKQYPYTGSKGQCKTQKGDFQPDFTMIQSLGCEKLKQNLYKSPIAVAVNAKNWQLYSTGIFNNCPTTSEVNHEIFLVGVTLTYWRLKNSWGSRWGEYGYIRVKLGNNCGICERPGYGFLL